MRSRFIYALPSIFLALTAIALAIYGLLLAPPSAPPPGSEQREQQAAEADSRQQVETYTYVISRQQLKPGDTLSAEEVTLFETTTELDDALLADSLIYEMPVTRRVRAGEIITESAFTQATRLQPLVDEGMRAVALELTPLTSIGGLVMPGDHLDIYGNFKADSDIEPVTVEILSKIEVLAVQGAVDPSEEQNNDAQRRNQTLVLSVPQDEVPRLLLASAESRLSFVATSADQRPVEESAVPEIEGELVVRDDEEPMPRLAFLNDIRPVRDEPDGEKEGSQPARNVAPDEEAKPEGRQVQIFEGSSTRSVYVQ